MTQPLAYVLQQLLNIMQLASFYMPLAVAFALIQAITRKVFLSFGDLAMFSSFAAVYVCFANLVDGYDESTAALISLAAAILSASAFGNVAARAIFSPMLKHSSQAFMIAAIGFSIAIQELMRLQSGGRDIWIPPLFQGLKLQFWPDPFRLQITAVTGVSILLSAASIAGLVSLLKATRFGRKWQACSQDIRLAKLCGVDSDAVMRHTFMLGAGLAAVSGWIAAISYGGTSFSSGLMLGFKAMFAAVIGGFGSLRGAMLGAISLSGLEVVWSAMFSTAYRDVFVFSFIIFVLLLRPEGLAGIGAQRESEML